MVDLCIEMMYSLCMKRETAEAIADKLRQLKSSYRGKESSAQYDLGFDDLLSGTGESTSQGSPSPPN